MRRLIVFASAIALIAFPASLSAQAEERGITCGLEGTAKFPSGLTVEMSEYKFSFKGDLSGCQSTGGATAGKVSAKGLANASCEFGTTEGKATVKWDNKKKTTLEFATTDIGASVTLEATVLKSTESSVAPGDTILGELTFQADVTQCVDGLKSADFIGQIGGGSPS
jgi:hypothetical protein